MKRSSPPFLHVVGTEQPKPERSRRPRRSKLQMEQDLAAQEPTPKLSPLICDCVKFVQANAADAAGWLADPSGNSDYADPLGESYRTTRKLALAQLVDANRPTPTLSEMRALAAVASVLLKQNIQDTALDPNETAVLRLFIRDAEAFLQLEIERQRAND